MSVRILQRYGNLQLYQTHVPLSPRTRYYLSFDARSSRGQDMMVRLQKHGAPYSGYSPILNVNLEQEWKTYTMDFVTSGFSTPVNDARFRFFFDWKPSVGDIYWFDNIRLATCPLNQLQADFTAAQTVVTLNEDVHFTDTTTGTPTAWHWDFGDGATSSQQNPTHSYASAETYTVSLTAGVGSKSDTATKDAYIDVGSPIDAQFTADPLAVETGTAVQFTDLSTGDPEAWAWDFGDGGTSTGQHPSHTYDTPGAHAVTLTASSQHDSNTETKTDYITVDERVVKTGFEHRYVRVQANLAAPGQGDRVINIVNDADQYGYNGLVLHDWGLYTLSGQSDLYHEQLASILAHLSALDWDLVPYVTGNSIGDITDPAFRVAYPVRDAEFIVGERGSALTMRDTENKVGNGRFDTDLNGWIVYSNEVQWDPSEGRSGPGAARFDLVADAHRRLFLNMSALDLNPFTTYTVKFWLRTEGLTDLKSPYVRIHRQYTLPSYETVSVDLLYNNGSYPMGAAVQENQGWVPYTIRFNTLDTDGVNNWPRLVIGSQTSDGTLWIDDVSITPSPLYNVVDSDNQRKVVVKLADDELGPQEPKLLKPYVHFRLEGNEIVNLAITETASSLVSVDWYQTPDYPGWVQLESVFCKPKLAVQFEDDVKAIIAGLSPDGILFGWNELRNFNWSPECGDMTSGELLAETTVEYQSRASQVDDQMRHFIWSDMYDPYHHALAPFYWASNGPFTESWVGLQQGKQTVMLNWNSPQNDPNSPSESCDFDCKVETKQASLAHFENLGVCQMLVGYYDSPTLLRDTEWSSALEQAMLTDPDLCLDGYMYGSWKTNGYDQLCDVAKYWTEQGRWSEPVLGDCP